MAERAVVENNIPLIELDEISFRYPGQERVLQRLSFSLYEGERIGLVGSNGSGKSTLLHLIMGLVFPDAGTLRLFGKTRSQEEDFRHLRPRMGFVFQNADDQLFSPTVLEDVAFGPLNMGKKPAEALALSRDMLKKLGLEGFEHRLTHKLSGGEKKLVSLATVLVMEPELLLLDEPTTGLDEQTVARMVALLNDLDIGYLVVSHETDFLRAVTKKIYTMDQGRIVSAAAARTPLI